jgi:hypothetical protein
MSTFTELYDTVEDDILFGWEVISMTNRDIQRWSKDHNKFIVCLEFADNEIKVPYYSLKVPCLTDVLACLIIDAKTTYDASFKDFCNELGYDIDSINDFRIYKRCKINQTKVYTLLGEELFQQFIDCEMDW